MEENQVISTHRIQKFKQTSDKLVQIVSHLYIKKIIECVKSKKNRSSVKTKNLFFTKYLSKKGVLLKWISMQKQSINMIIVKIDKLQ